MAEDAGLLINPMIADGQVHGGVAQGIGNALLEEIVYDEHRQPADRDASPITCRRPRMRSRPSSCITPETSTNARSRRPRALGEGGSIGAPAAVINAINDALSPFGVEIDEMPGDAATHSRRDPEGEEAA